MGRFIVKIEEYYLEWSTIVDAPVTFGMSRPKFEAYMKEMYGLSGIRDLESRLVRADETGTSLLDGSTAKEVTRRNHAGPEETRLTLGEIYKAYCLRKPIRDGWLVPTVDENEEE